MRLALTYFQVHSLALWLLELRPQRSWQDSNLRQPALQTSASPLGHMIESQLNRRKQRKQREKDPILLSPLSLLPPVQNLQHAEQGSNLSSPDLEAGVPPLGLSARDDASSFSNAQDRTRTCEGHKGQRVYSPLQLPLCHLRERQTKSVSVEGFEPSTPCARGTCAAKLRYTLRK